MRKLLLSIVAAVLVSAAPAAAAPPAAGVVEHRVYSVYVAAPQPRETARRRVEHFVARGRDRAVITDADGRMTSELVKHGTELRSWEREDNVLAISRAGIAGRNFLYSRTDDGEHVAARIADGTYRVAGETAWHGRAALRLEVPPDVPGRTITHVIAQDTRQLLEVTEVDKAGRVTLSRKLLVDEDLPLTAEHAAKLEMSAHPGATVRSDAAKAKKKAKRRKTKPTRRRR